MRRERNPGDPRPRRAGGEETRAGENGSRGLRLTGESPAGFSGYETVVGSDIYGSFSDFDRNGGKIGSTSETDLFRPSFGSQLRGKDGGTELVGNTGRRETDSDLLWGDFQPGTNDEVHFITTHEIQLYELDHDGDCEFGLGSSCALEESSIVYSFLDSSSLESDASEEGSETPRGTSCAGETPPVSGAAEEAPGQEIPRNGESVAGGGRPAEAQQPGSAGSTGHIHLSIRASSRAVGENRGDQEKGKVACARTREEETEQHLRGNSECLTGGARADRAKFAAKSEVGGKGLEFYSGSSSAVSELDDADKEVGSLTARAFHSLACPGDEYFDTYCPGDRSTGLSSLSEQSIGLNRWAEYVDAHRRNATEDRNPSEFPGGKPALAAGPPRAEAPSNKGPQAPTGLEGKHLPVKDAASAVHEKQEKPAEASSGVQTKRRIQVTGKFEEIGSRVITLTETLNFNYDVKEQIPAGRESQRSVHPMVRNSGGSRCADGVTEAAPREQGGDKETWRAVGDMESTQKKSKFASNLLQSVIWKKMQYEQELRMERGEITDTSFAGRTSPSLSSEFPKAATRDADPGDLQKANCNQFSGGGGSGSPESSPVPGEVCGEAAKGTTQGSVTTGRNFPAPATAAAAAAAGDLVKAAGETYKGSLFQSQHSAFRSWKEGECKRQQSEDRETRENKAGQRVRAQLGRQALCKERKMSHLFVPSIQRAAKGTGAGERAKRTTQPQGGGHLPPKGAAGEGAAADGQAAPCRSPEIRIKLRSRKESKPSPFSIAKLLTPKIGGNVGNLPGRSADDPKYQALSMSFLEEALQGGEEKIRAPQFTVRDIRDNIHRLQAPIHQVRDVKKLVKSSYHILTLEGSKLHGNEQLPIVIKCQAVSRKDLPGALKPVTEERGGSKAGSSSPSPDSSPSMKNGSAFVHRASGRVPLKEAAGGGGGGVRRAAGSPPAAAGAEKPPPSAGGKVASKQLALEKLTAAVKTMEELYVFDKNEWKRKSESGPGSLAGSHVLSLIASEEASGPEREREREGPARPPGQDPARKAEPAAPTKPPGAPPSLQPGSKCTVPQLFTVAPVLLPPPPPLSQSARESKPARVRSPPAPAPPPPPPEFRSLRAPRRQSLEESEKQSKAAAAMPTPADSKSCSQYQQQSLPSEYENYLTIPIKQPPAPLPATTYSLQSPSPKHQRVPSPATIYHQPAPQRIAFSPPRAQPPERISPIKVQQPVLVESPPVPCFPAPHTQRKMLLDPTTGQYYLVDTPMPPAHKRLYDPETRQYVDVPMPQQPLAPMSVPMSPIAINPGTYGTTYMIYPGFLPTPTMLPTLQTQLSRPENECNESRKANSTVSQHSEAHYMESPYYFPTGKSLNRTQTLTSQHITGASKGFSDSKPVISITSQPGPRIIAPPSFDGTTMSFVVEHR
ncbi:uncharacterized protein C4orf54 homolog [Carcharodon carcharias]|uniref:uncharacterized protein C4orf54 homolog n=1 Tax=Carcharodon carcharias TaxID=13397 RepID=UPI001B7EEEED|nr:uncharacterized protein C4orf54 homolog [Carcharodon carcharias]XP_041050559.1 uncharacterized protein C4orf54 homolog [Carcharodon carcharias]XP_041050560.1 uncharacterized protein C4orf54 homolog [Carcharodon carcharias]